MRSVAKCGTGQVAHEFRANKREDGVLNFCDKTTSRKAAPYATGSLFVLQHQPLQVGEIGCCGLVTNDLWWIRNLVRHVFCTCRGEPTTLGGGFGREVRATGYLTEVAPEALLPSILSFFVIGSDNVNFCAPAALLTGVLVALVEGHGTRESRPLEALLPGAGLVCCGVAVSDVFNVRRRFAGSRFASVGPTTTSFGSHPNWE